MFFALLCVKMKLFSLDYPHLQIKLLWTYYTKPTYYNSIYCCVKGSGYLQGVDKYVSLGFILLRRPLA